MEAEAVAEIDMIFGIVENAVEAFVKMWDVITAVKIVIDEDLPIAVECVVTAFEPVKVAHV